MPGTRPASRRPWLTHALICGVLGILAGCSGGSGSNSPGQTGSGVPIVMSIQITPASPQVAAGMKTQLTATAVMSDNTHKDITAQVSWKSSNPAAATISNSSGSNGLVTALTSGATTISASSASVMGQTSLAVTAALLTSIEVTPPSPSIAKGTSAQFSATGVFSDHSTQSLTSQVTWTSSDTSIAAISSAAGSNGRATGTGVGTVRISANLNGISAPSATLTVTAATLVSIQLTPPSPSVPKGLTQQFTATGVYSDNSTQDLTSAATWSSSDSSIAGISNTSGSNGLASATGVGSSSISASLGGITSADATLTVTAATLDTIQVTPPNPSLANGLSQQFTAIGVYSDNSTQNLTSVVTWSSSNSAVATVSNAGGSSGLGTAVGVGSTGITASSGLVVSPAVTLTVTPATLVSIQVTPANPSIAKGLTLQFTATGTYSDSSTQDLTQSATWSSSVPVVATISNAGGTIGLASAAGIGSTSISAIYNGVSSPGVSLGVTAATLVSIAVTPPAPSIANGLTQQFSATGVYTDSSTQDLTQSVTWSSDTPTVATISNALGTNGLASAAGTGAASISASFNGVTAPAAMLTVTPATLISIQVTPPSPSIANGLTEQFTATGTYSDSSTQDLTSVATWVSTNTSVASISSAPGSYGLAAAAAVGSTSVSATYSGVTSPNAALTVTAATLVSIQVTPPSPSIANGLTQQFMATGLYTDNSTQDLTSVATWVSTNPSVASISSAPGSYGLATAAAVGSTSVSATYSGVTSPNAVLTVTAATLVSIQVTPPSPSIANGLTQQFMATGLYTDNSTQDLTASVSWASSNGGVATISNASGSSGLASASGVGTTSIAASFNGITSPSATLSVTTAALVSIQVTPAVASIPKGLTQQFIATGTYTDNSAQDLTATATWGATPSGTATISNAAGSQGLATATAAGSTNISATYSGVTSPAASLTVTTATLVSIQVSPSSASIANGTTEPYDAVGTFTDNSLQDLTTVATWTSSNTAVATISNAAGSNGIATAAAVGSTNLSAAFSGVTSPVAALTVVAPLPGVAGVWTAVPGAGETAGMISDGAGNFYFFDLTATCFGLYNGTLTLSGSTVSGSGDFAPSAFGPNSGCPGAVHENYSGSLVPGVSMTLTGTAAGGGAPSPTINFTFSSVYSQASAVALVAGSWLMQGGSPATISSTGAISGTDTSTGCTVTGHVSVSNSSVNLYNVSVTYSGCTGGPAALNGIPLNGVGTLDTSQTPTVFAVGVRSANRKTESVFFWTQQ